MSEDGFHPRPSWDGSVDRDRDRDRDSDASSPPSFAPPDSEEYYAHSFRDAAFDFAGTAAVLARALPSAQYIFLTTRGFFESETELESGDVEETLYECWYTSRGWRVAGPGPGPGTGPGTGVGVLDGLSERRVIELHDAVVETIIRKEELVCSQQDEVSWLFLILIITFPW